ncbi:hypothetical protein U1Q18_040604, partial [Sarracenia purpurea var. burkii]
SLLRPREGFYRLFCCGVGREFFSGSIFAYCDYYGRVLKCASWTPHGSPCFSLVPARRKPLYYEDCLRIVS